ncbi:MAG TPA: glycosyltransferase family 87 protein, partial [Caulobacteraceae bacterium]|nr:glycosyltransferase family 87 protein [Caulobacteraceae bacterium]
HAARRPWAMFGKPLPAWLASDPRAEARLRLALSALAFLIGATIAAVRTRYGAADFDVFWAAARHPFTPYDPRVIAELKAMMHIEGEWPFVYPPTFLLFAWPFGLMPLGLAYPLWAGLGMALFVLASSFMVRPVWANALLFLTPCVVFAVAPGQSTPFVGAAAIAAFNVVERRPWLAGALFAVAACLKPQAMVLAPVVLWGRWRTLAGAVAAGLALMAASCVFGADLWLQWPRTLVAFRDVMPTVSRVNPSALIASPVWALALALFGLALAWRSKDLFGLVAGGLCLTPYAHDYDLAPLAPVAITWIAERRRLGWGHAALGGAFLAGLVRSPLATTLFLAGAAILKTPWLAGAMKKGAPVARSPFPNSSPEAEA